MEFSNMEPSTELPGPLKEMVLPLFYRVGNTLKGVGTGFIISSCGVLLTAAHVSDEVRNHNDPTRRPNQDVYDHAELWAALSSDVVHGPGGEYFEGGLLRLLDVLWLPGGDIAVGRLPRQVDGQEVRYSPLSISFDFPTVGERVVSAGYPKIRGEISERVDAPDFVARVTVQGVIRSGQITQLHGSGRDSFMRWPAAETDVQIDSGMSGGPVFRSGSGRAFGVASTSISLGADDPGPPISYFALLYPAVALPVPPDPLSHDPVRQPTLAELIRERVVDADESFERLSISQDDAGRPRVEIRHV